MRGRVIWPCSTGHKYPLAVSGWEVCTFSAGSALDHLPASSFTCFLTSTKMEME